MSRETEDFTSIALVAGKMKCVPYVPGMEVCPNSAPDSLMPNQVRPVAAGLDEVVVVRAVVVPRTLRQERFLNEQKRSVLVLIVVTAEVVTTLVVEAVVAAVVVADAVPGTI